MWIYDYISDCCYSRLLRIYILSISCIRICLLCSWEGQDVQLIVQVRLLLTSDKANTKEIQVKTKRWDILKDLHACHRECKLLRDPHLLLFKVTILTLILLKYIDNDTSIQQSSLGWHVNPFLELSLTFKAASHRNLSHLKGDKPRNHATQNS